MANRITPPEYKLPRFNCPRCGAFAGQEWRQLSYLAGYEEYNQSYYEELKDGEQGSTWYASSCASCMGNCLWIDTVLVYPADRPGLSVPVPADEMPGEVKDLYLEASAVLPYSRRAAAALCRASLERLAKLLTPDEKPGTSLDNRLIALSGRTTGALTKGLQIIRHAGNTALHGARDDDASVVIYMDGDEADMIELFFVTINELVDELIARPARIESAYSLIPDEKRKAVEKKIAQANGGGG